MRLIELVDVSKHYRLSGGTAVEAVRNVTAAFQAGEFAMIFGRSGSGKTTLLSLIAGLTKPSSGKVLFEGVDLFRLSDSERTAFRSRKVGFIFQYPTLIPTLNILENVRLPAVFAGSGERKSYERALELLESVGLKDKAQAYPSQLSAGQLRRVQIVRALMNAPPVILADEPTGELDEATERQIMDLLSQLHSKGATIIMVSHTKELAPYATRLFTMENGVLKELKEQ